MADKDERTIQYSDPEIGIPPWIWAVGLILFFVVFILGVIFAAKEY